MCFKIMFLVDCQWEMWSVFFIAWKFEISELNPFRNSPSNATSRVGYCTISEIVNRFILRHVIFSRKALLKIMSPVTNKKCFPVFLLPLHFRAQTRMMESTKSTLWHLQDQQRVTYRVFQYPDLELCSGERHEIKARVTLSREVYLCTRVFPPRLYRKERDFQPEFALFLFGFS